MLQPLPSPTGEEVRPLRIAIAAVISPQGTAESYAPLVDYLGERLNRPIEILQRRTYAEINELLRNGEVDLAFVCTSSYLLGRREFGLELLVAPQVNGETTYRAKLIVPVDGEAESMDDLRGKVFAFTDPNSFTGRIYPIFLLQQNGETAETFFGRTFFTYSHDDAIYAVASGIADGASVDSLILDYVLERDPDLAGRLRIIHTSPPFGIPPVVVSPGISPQLRAELKALLLVMHETPEGLAALKDLGVDRFVQVSYEDYRSAEEIEIQVTSSEIDP
ncbi:MAG: phosphate/phosphite/phosphonate ABC transporter substrate-binding protein [Anaerolineales bacterium]